MGDDAVLHAADVNAVGDKLPPALCPMVVAAGVKLLCLNREHIVGVQVV